MVWLSQQIATVASLIPHRVKPCGQDITFASCSSVTLDKSLRLSESWSPLLSNACVKLLKSFVFSQLCFMAFKPFGHFLIPDFSNNVF
jgi:hypothetical protein